MSSRSYKVWGCLNPISKGSIVLRLTTYLDELRRVTSPKITSFDGGAIQDEHGLLFEGNNTSGGPFSDNQSLWVAVTSNLQGSHSRTMQQALIGLRAVMPHGFLAVLAHADLHQGNIIIRNRNIAAIIDWEGSGCFPRWMKYVQYHPVSDAPEYEFENLVVEGMKDYPDDSWLSWMRSEARIRGRVGNRAVEALSSVVSSGRFRKH